MTDDRATVLLKAALDILRKCDFALEETTFYDEAECDGFCLKGDIECFLELGQYEQT